MVGMSGLLMLGMGPGERWRTTPAVGEACAGWRAGGRWGRRGGEGVEAASWGGVARGVHHLPLKMDKQGWWLWWRPTDESAVSHVSVWHEEDWDLTDTRQAVTACGCRKKMIHLPKDKLFVQNIQYLIAEFSLCFLNWVRTMEYTVSMSIIFNLAFIFLCLPWRQHHHVVKTMLFFTPPLLFSSCCDCYYFCSFQKPNTLFSSCHITFARLTRPCFSSFHWILSILANLVMQRNVIHRKYWSVTKEFVLLSFSAHGQIHIHTVYSHSYMRWLGLHKLFGYNLNKQQNQ